MISQVVLYAIVVVCVIAMIFIGFGLTAMHSEVDQLLSVTNDDQQTQNAPDIDMHAVKSFTVVVQSTRKLESTSEIKISRTQGDGQALFSRLTKLLAGTDIVTMFLSGAALTATRIDTEGDIITINATPPPSMSNTPFTWSVAGQVTDDDQVRVAVVWVFV